MKKFLFTLATLIAAGFAVNAQVPTFAFSESEITLAPGETQAISVYMTEDAGLQLYGGQLQFIMYDANHNELEAGVIIDKVNIGTPRTPIYVAFKPGVIITDLGTSLSETVLGARYRALFVSMGGNPVLMGDEVSYYTGEGIVPEVFEILLKVEDGFEGEFATLELVDNDDMHNVFVDQVQQKFFVTQSLSLKINNSAFTPAEDKDLTGEIMFGEMDENGNVPVWYEGPEEVTLTVTIDGVEVEVVDGMINLGTYGDHTVVATVTAEGYKTESRTKIFTWEEPAPVATDTPVVTFEMRGEVLWCVITGEGDIYVDGVNYGTAPVEFVVTTQTEQDQEGYYMVYAIADGKTQSEVVTAEWTCPAKVVEPEVTPTPEIVITETDDAIIIDVIGEGEIHVYVNGEEVEVPCTIAKGDEAQEIVVTATAQADGKEISITAEETVTVPAKTETPDDPHMVGAWIVLIDENGNECWYEMSYDAEDANWFIMKTLHHQPWPVDVPFYFVVNGVRYGAEADMTLPEMGDTEHTILNPVYETENYFYVPAAYTYTWGLQFVDGEIYLLVAQGKMTDVNEINGDKPVANVRYFNMAGQEMQQANGMTIVVTTYTDGTTSAVKVMK